MFNLLKSDCYRLVHGKTLWAMTACLVAVAVLAAWTIHFVSSPEFLYASSQSMEMTVSASEGEGDAAGVAEGAEASDDEGDEIDAAAAQALQASGKPASEVTVADFEGVSREMRTLESPLDMLGDAALSGGLVSLLTCLLVTLLFAGDFTTGFVRNLVMDRRGRLRYYGEKIILAGLAALYFLVVAVVACLVAFAVAGFTYAHMNTVGEVAEYLLLALLLAWAYGCLTAVAIWLTRSSGFGIAFAIVVGTGMAGALLGQGLLVLAGGLVPWAGAVEPWLLASGQQALGAGATNLMEGALTGSSGASAVVRIVVASAFWIAASAALTFGWLRKRDV